MNKRIYLDCRWSHDVDSKYINDFILIQNEVFKNHYDLKLFQKKYIDNIYGSSVLIVAYVDNIPAGARTLWRNDVDEFVSYQFCDTCVKAEFRGMGIFSMMTSCAVSNIDKSALLYNFPNINSFPGYLKLGYELQREYHLNLLLSNKKYMIDNPHNINSEYVEWWLKGNHEIKYLKFGKAYYLIKKYPRPLCYKIIGRVNESDAMLFEKINHFCIPLYLSLKKNWYNAYFLPVRQVGNSNERIPTWKIDAI